MTWGGWVDDLSGLWKYDYEVFEVKGTPLRENDLITNGTVYLNSSFVSITELTSFQSGKFCK